MANHLPKIRPDNPSLLGWPATLPIEVAMRVGSTKEICEAYQIDRAEWDVLCADPRFRNEVQAAKDRLKEEGVSFRMKAQLQSEELLEQSWRMIHDANLPASVRADLLKFTVRVAGLEPKDTKGSAGDFVPLQINIQLNS